MSAMTRQIMRQAKLALPRRRWSLFTTGAAFLVALAVATTLIAFKAPIQTSLRSGQTISAEFDEYYNFQIRPHESEVQLNSLEVGVVSDVEHTDEGSVLVSMKVDEAALAILGPEPSALIAPVTVLGGKYSIRLAPGGGRGPFEDNVIPIERTHVPVELDRVLESLPRPTRESLQDMVGHLDDTLAEGGRDALRDLVAEAPDALEPTGRVMEAAQGTRPGVDLPKIVSNFHATADVLSEYEGQLGGIVASLRETTAVLAEQSEPLAAGFDALPETLRATRTGVTDLSGTLDRLTETADSFRPAARELHPLVRDLTPVLRDARPLMRDVRALMKDARPAVEQLVPVAQRGTKLFDNLSGPVLDRVNGPITDTVMNTWRGTGPYEGSGGGMQADNKFYEEVGYMAANVARASQLQDAQGAALGFQAGGNARSLAGLPGEPFNLANLLEEIEKYAGGSR